MKTKIQLPLYASIVILFFTVGCMMFKGGFSFGSQENYFQTALYSSGLPIKIANTGPWEMGETFLAKSGGKIKSINIKNPELGVKRITIWDTETRLPIATYSLKIENIKDYHKIFVDFPLVQGKIYTLSFNTVSYYYHELNFKKLPLSDEHFTLISTNYKQGHWQQFPEFSTDNIIHGFIDIDFEWAMN